MPLFHGMSYKIHPTSKGFIGTIKFVNRKNEVRWYRTVFPVERRAVAAKQCRKGIDYLLARWPYSDIAHWDGEPFE